MMGHASSKRTRRLGLFGLAGVFTLLNAGKPLVIDDAAYYYFARQIASAPLDPYGFAIFWYEAPQPANEVLAPPVLPYWWALALRLFGDQPFAWKLWLLPFSVLLVGSLYALARRFARGAEGPLVLLLVLSPAFLPALNLMLDVPALALGLAALALFVRGGGRGPWWRILLSGLVAGLAMQTKYTAVVIPVAMLAYALLRRRWLRGVAAAATAALVFVAWEALMAAKYGASHFLLAYRDGRLPWPEWVEAKSFLGWPLLTILGAVAPGVGLFGLAALGVARRGVLAAGVAVVLGYLAVAFVPERWAVWVESRAGSPWRIHLDDVIYGTFGICLAVVLAAVGWRLCRRPVGRRDTVFLLIWLLLELGGYFALTPFPAARRVLGVVVVLTLLAGQLAARSRPPLGRLVAFNAALGILFWLVDLHGAMAHRAAAEVFASDARTKDAGARVWFVGHWGFQFYAERAGMVPVVPGASQLRRGDWLVVPDERHVHQQRVVLDPDRLLLEEERRFGDWLPLRTVACYYGGHVPLEHQEGPRVLVRLYRVRENHVPAWKPYPR